MSYLAPIIINPQTKPKYCVIWLHGLGASGDDFASAVAYLKLPENHQIRFIFPHAKSQAVTINNGVVMPSWYDIYEVSIAAKIDWDGIKQSAEYLKELVDEQKNQGILEENIIVAGFSQGGVIAFYYGLNYKCAGIIALSTYLVEMDIKSKVPVFLGHGEFDDIIDYSLAKKSKERLEENDIDVDFYNYPITHSVNLEEFVDIGKWLIKVL